MSEDSRPRRPANGGGARREGPRGERGGRGGGKGGYQGSGRGQDRPGRKRDWSRPADRQTERTAAQKVYDGPEIPSHITGRELDKQLLAQLKGLPEKLAQRVARHLAAATELIDSDPETAYQHTLAAKARAQRLAVVREATGEAAYAAGHYAEALADLRAAKRMNGATDYLPIMADCHRALGQPEQALKLARSPSVPGFKAPAKAEMTIVEAGARRDLGQYDAALRTLELRAPSLEPPRAVGGATALRLRGRPGRRRPAGGRARLVPPHPRHRQRRDHRRGRAGRAARAGGRGVAVRRPSGWHSAPRWATIGTTIT